MSNSFFEIGMKIEMEVERDQQKIYLPTKVEDLDGDTIFLGMPFHEGKIFYLEDSESIKIYFGKNDGFYFAQAKVVSKKYAPIPLVGVVLLGRPQKNQRRDYFRVQVIRRIKIRLLNANNWESAFLADLSASGALIYFGRDLQKDELLEIRLPLDFKELVVKARVARVEKDETRQVQQYNIGIQFMDIDEKVRDDIIKFLLTEQRKLRQKGYL